MNHELVDRWCQRGILGLVLAILVFGPLATGAVRTGEFLVLQGLTVGALILWLIRLWLGENHRLLWTPLSWAVLAFAAYAIIRYCQADIEYVARQELIKVLLYAFLFFLILNHLHHQDSMQLVAYVLFALATLVSLYAIYQFATDSPYVWDFIKPKQYAKRASGTYICPNHLAAFLELILPLALGHLFLGRVNHLARILIGYAALLMLAGIGVSLSRGGWIATALALALFFVLLLRNRNYRLPALLFLAALLVAGAVFIAKTKHSQERIQYAFTTGTYEDVRFKLWPPAVRMWEDHPWFGVGPAHFDYRFRQYRPEDVQNRPDRVHNDYLNTLVDWGVLGALLVASAWVILYSGALKSWKFVRYSGDGLKSRQTNKAAWVLGASLGLLALLLHSFVDFNFHIPANAILAVTLMALLSSHLRFATDRYWVSSGWLVRSLVTLLCLAGILVLGGQGIRLCRELTVLKQAARTPEYSLARAALLRKAFQAEPKNFETSYELGEIYRVACSLGNPDAKEMGDQAIQWFQKTQNLNPFDAYNCLRYAMTLDYLKRFDAATPLMKRANDLDPNGYYIRAHQGWHFVQLAANAEWDGKYDQAREFYTNAKEWFERSLRVKYYDNTIAIRYQGIVQRKLTELAQMK